MKHSKGDGGSPKCSQMRSEGAELGHSNERQMSPASSYLKFCWHLNFCSLAVSPLTLATKTRSSLQIQSFWLLLQMAVLVIVMLLWLLSVIVLILQSETFKFMDTMSKSRLITLQTTQWYAIQVKKTWIRIWIRNPDPRLDPDPESGSRKKRIFDKLTPN